MEKTNTTIDVSPEFIADLRKSVKLVKADLAQRRENARLVAHLEDYLEKANKVIELYEAQ